MIRRLALIGFLTGIGHIFSIFSLKEIASNTDSILFSQIGKADSLLFFLVNAIAFGLQSSAIRDIATSKSWQLSYKRIQSARLSLSLLLVVGSLTSYWSKSNYIYLLAPLLALSGDYALYALGKSVTGSFIALFRIAVPYLSTLITSFFYPLYALEIFILSTALIYLSTDFIIAAILKCPFYTKPSFSGLQLYLRNIPLGLVTISLYFLGLGLMLFVEYFYESKLTNVVFLGLKLYMIFKGIIRIIHQAFIKEMVNTTFCKEVDKLSSQLGLAFFVVPAFFPTTFITIFFGSEYIEYKYFFVILGLSGFVYSLFSSVTTKALLEKIDMAYAKISVLSASVSILLVLAASFIKPQNSSIIAFSLLIGEVLFSYLMVKALKNYNSLGHRLLEIQTALITLISFSLVRLTTGDSTISLVISMVIFALIFVKSNWHNMNQKIESNN